ncbi:unnamed protein product, partial [Pleuronectes platessa]
MRSATITFTRSQLTRDQLATVLIQIEWITKVHDAYTTHTKLRCLKVMLLTQDTPLSKAPYSPNICSPGAVHGRSLLCVSCTRWVKSRGNGIEPWSFWLVDGPLYILSHNRFPQDIFEWHGKDHIGLEEGSETRLTLTQKGDLKRQRTFKQAEEPGIKLLTFCLVGDPLYFLSSSGSLQIAHRSRGSAPAPLTRSETQDQSSFTWTGCFLTVET